jgi:quercetin dioxygenase-like cupin family protein
MAKGYVSNIEEKTVANKNYLKVLFTGPKSQLVVMSLKPGEEIGEETHDLDQFTRIEAGQGEVILSGKKHKVEDGFAVVIPAGTKHNVVNTSKKKDLKIYTVYSKPDEHKPGTIHKTKAAADKAEAKEHGK